MPTNSWKPRVTPGKHLPLKRSYVLMAAALAAYLPVASFAGPAAAGASPSAMDASAGAADASPMGMAEFDDVLLMKAPGERINVARYERNNPVPPGSYTVDLYVNGEWVAHTDVRFSMPPGGDSALPCFDRALVERIGLNTASLSDAGQAEMAKVQAGGCADFSRLVTDAKQAFDMSDFRLDLSVPQIALMRNPRGYVSPELWDKGVTSATLGYNVNTYHTESRSVSTTRPISASTAGSTWGAGTCAATAPSIGKAESAVPIRTSPPICSTIFRRCAAN